MPPAPKHLTLEQLGYAKPGAAFGNAVVDFNVSTKPRHAGSYLWPLVDIAGVNLFLWGFSYATGAPWAKVSPETWKANLQAGLQWDDNEFEVNQLFHPYQGSMYFSAARVHGLNFWEAVPYTLAGSFMWEYFAETEQPSTNDWMTTTWGGFFFGEALFRLSNRLLDESASGSRRFFKEFAALAVNPVSGLDRLASGRAWADGPRQKQFPLLVNLRVGVDGLGLSEGTGWGKTFRAKIRFDYGDLYAKPNITTPFEYFNLSAQLHISGDTLGEGFDGTGVLLGHRFATGPNYANLVAWVLDYEYFTNGTTQMLSRNSDGIYSLAEMGTGPSWFGHWGLGSGFSIDSEVDVLGVPTGSITSPYAKYESNRSYNYGVGGALKAEINLRHERLGRLYSNVSRYLFTVVDGVKGTEHLGVFQLGAWANIYNGHGLGFTAIRYDRHSNYDNYPDVTDFFWSGQAHYEVEW